MTTAGTETRGERTDRGGDPLRDWLDRLNDRDLPVLGGTVHELCNTADDNDSAASDLARVVLRDASLTSDLIRTANSAYFNPGGNTISTVSRAVVLLGFDTVRSIGLSIAVIDSLVRGTSRERAHRLFRECVAAALCARAMAQSLGDPEPEEVFIAALLYRIGELAFWCLADAGSARTLDAALGEAGDSPRDAERDCLGFSLRALSRAIVREWRLGDIIQEALRPGAPRTMRAELTRSAQEVMEAVWRAEPATATRRLMDTTGLDDAGAEAVLQQVEDELPVFGQALGLDFTRPAPSDPPRPDTERIRAPDPMLQLRILREMTATVRESRDLQTLLGLLTEGLYRGLALDRCAVATLRRGDRGLGLRSSLGDSGALAAALDAASLDTPCGRTLCSPSVRVLGAGERVQLGRPLADALLGHVLIGPLRVGERVLGVIIGERREAPHESGDDLLEGFSHFVDQTELCVGRLMR